MKHWINRAIMVVTLGFTLGFVVMPAHDEDSANQWWQHRFNYAAEQLDELYLPTALLVSVEGKCSDTAPARVELHLKRKKRWGEITKIEDLYTASVKDTLRYEIGRFETSEKGAFAHLIVWRYQSDYWRREVEVIAPYGEVKVAAQDIDGARAAWIEACNRHDPLALVKEHYAAHAVYYSHKPHLQGTEAIAKEYGYMARANYQLNLTPLWMEPVSDDLAFEIGQCDGSYRGKYMLVWQKGRDGAWRVLFDSNL